MKSSKATVTTDKYYTISYLGRLKVKCLHTEEGEKRFSPDPPPLDLLLQYSFITKLGCNNLASDTVKDQDWKKDTKECNARSKPHSTLTPHQYRGQQYQISQNDHEDGEGQLC